MDISKRPIAIDPPGCGCTECGIGEYIPLDRMTDALWIAHWYNPFKNNTYDDDPQLELMAALVAVRYLGPEAVEDRGIFR